MLDTVKILVYSDIHSWSQRSCSGLYVLVHSCIYYQILNKPTGEKSRLVCLYISWQYLQLCIRTVERIYLSVSISLKVGKNCRPDYVCTIFLSTKVYARTRIMKRPLFNQLRQNIKNSSTINWCRILFWRHKINDIHITLCFYRPQFYFFHDYSPCSFATFWFFQVI